tara:strand:- start:24 stop:1775 length:1752 start_codon:yes stop_codon:yes gene_type:complete
MKSFFKKIFSTILSVLVSFFVLLIIGVVFISVAISAFENEKDIVVKPNSILHIKLNSEVVERASSNPFSNLNQEGDKGPMELKDILDKIEKAKTDENIKLIYLNIDNINAGVSQILEIRNKLLEFKKTNKPIIAYSEVYSQLGYYLSSVADSIYMHKEGMLELNGFSAEIMFYKDLLKKLDIDIQVIKHGKYKSAVEPFILDKMSQENRAQVKLLLESMYNNVFDSIASQRDIASYQIRDYINELALESPNSCKKLGFVDRLIYEDELREIMRNITGNKKLNYVSLQKYSKSKESNQINAKEKIAIIYANGDIESGNGDYNTIGSTTTAKAIREARKNSDIKAIVFRVNSPGGSALASDVILREALLAKKQKPFIVSMGDYAASGGYYISCMADKIVANPTTITGSIGVFGMVPNLERFYKNKLGISIDTVKTNKYSDMGFNRKLSDFERNKIKSGVKRIYDTFIGHVSLGRNMSKDDVNTIGQGRVWSGYDAKKIDLIDEYGGLETAISIASQMAEIDNFKIISLPKKKDPLESLMSEIKIKHSFQNFLNTLGIDTEFTDSVKKILDEDPVQARIPYIIKLK